PTPQVVVLGAGLDSRAWRMPELADIDVFEVDHPASQVDKQARVESLRPTSRSVRFVPVDFTQDRLDAGLVKAGRRSDTATVWIWEGVVPYLRKVEVVAALRAISVLSHEGSRLIVNYQSPSMRARAGRLLAGAMSMTAGRRSMWAEEPRRSAWR